MTFDVPKTLEKSGFDCEFMTTSSEPKIGYGFIYILSNPSMPNVYKVGLTTSSVKKRIQELTSTGVPKPFTAEKIFEVPENSLRQIEQLAHKKLKNKDLHHGKEFFEGKIDDCINAVQDAIYEITKSNSPELIGLAKERARDDEIRKEQLKRQKIWEQDQLAKLDEEILATNKEVEINRLAYAENLRIEEKNQTTFTEKYFYIPVAAIGLMIAAYALVYEYGFTAFLIISVLTWWFLSTNKKEEKDKFYKLATEKFPYYNRGNIHTFNNAKQIQEQKQQNIANPAVKNIDTSGPGSLKTTPISRGSTDYQDINLQKYRERQETIFIDSIKRRKNEIENIDEEKSDGWICNSSKSLLFHPKSNQLLSVKSGLGFSIAGDFFILHNKTVPVKLKICEVPIDDFSIKKICDGKVY
jgi:hypothetical protein